MPSLSYHAKPNGTTYVYRQESYWDKSKKQARNKQVCIGKLGPTGEVVYNKRFSRPEARQALEHGESVAESVLIGQSLVLKTATDLTGIERVVRRCFEPATADVLLSLAWAVAAGVGQMYLASVWMEQNECAAHRDAPTSQDISRLLAQVSQSEVDTFLAAWAAHRAKITREQYCYDITSVSSHNTSNPFVEWGHNRDRENLTQVNMALLTGVTSRIPTYYELHPGSMSDTTTLKGFIQRMDKYQVGRIRTLLDRGFYSASNIKAMLDAGVGFYIPVPANIAWAKDLIDASRDAVEMPEHIIAGEEGRRQALYAMTVLGTMEGKRVWRHVYYDAARRCEHIESLFASLQAWESELMMRLGTYRQTSFSGRYGKIVSTPTKAQRTIFLAFGIQTVS